jgi:two-component system sensor histidine kinase AlgZ
MALSGTEELWLPDLCSRPRVLTMLGMAELVVVLVALWPAAENRLSLSQFMSASAFALWMAIAVTVLLCLSRPQLSRLPRVLGILGLMSLTAMVSISAASVIYALYTALGQAPVGVGFSRFVMASAAISLLVTASVLRYFYVSDRWTAQINASARAEADALQARIRPHFLFNSMNLIASLVRRDPVVAEQAVLDLSDLFRAALGVGEGDSSLAQEVELAERYLSIESLRLGDRLQVDWQKQEPLPWTMRLPHLVLQPLVENAVLHGISRLPEGGCVRIRVYAEGNLLHLGVSNPALSPEAPTLILQKGAGHAQRSIAYRLEYKFGRRATLTGQWQEGIYTCDMAVPL